MHAPQIANTSFAEVWVKHFLQRSIRRVFTGASPFETSWSEVWGKELRNRTSAFCFFFLDRSISKGCIYTHTTLVRCNTAVSLGASPSPQTPWVGFAEGWGMEQVCETELALLLPFPIGRSISNYLHLYSYNLCTL
jgi:hypothetical protein